MLLGGIGLVSALAAVGVCRSTGGFEGLGWIWMAPAVFVGSFLVLLAAAFAFLYVVCKRVDQTVPQEHDSPFYRQLTNLYIDALVTLARVRVKTAGLEQTPKEGRFLLVCNHQHMADPGILLKYFRKSQLAFISKQENRDMFIVGKLMHKILCQTLDRNNDRQALRTILKCIQLLKEDEVSVGVFPEGYTCKDGKLHKFRPGVFKIAQKAGVPIVVCTIRGTFGLFQRMKGLKRTDVELHLVGVIPAEELKGRTTVEISDRVHAMMARDLGEDLVAES